ncbi:F-box/kelch-repeat protein [Citrus sinensis]|nr:F-box/kelch-repeat protein [Citrus sinensis]
MSYSSSTTTTEQEHNSDGVESFPLDFGFGYDPKSNDDKVVRILTFIADPEEVASVKVEMYTLSTDSWRGLSFMDPFEAGIRHLLSFGWHVAICVVIMFLILSFDMSDEVFGQISVPKCSFKAREESRKLIVFNESLAFDLYDAYQTRNSFEIWVMDEFVIDAAWKKTIHF